MEDGEKPGARSDLAQAVFWLAIGGLIFYGSWTMDRLEKVGVQPYSAPGLLPGILGVFIALLGAAMLVRSLRAGALRAAPHAGAPSIEWRRIVLPLGLCVAFAAGLVGHGLPFWLAAWMFVTTMVCTLQYRER